MMKIPIRTQALISCQRLLSQLNRDPATSTTGCFDRRYWGWKLTDFPEATFQRNVAPGKLYTPAETAGRILRVLEHLGPTDSGRFFDWDGSEIPW